MDTCSSIGKILGRKCREIKRKQLRIIEVRRTIKSLTMKLINRYRFENESFRMLLRLLEQSKEPLVLCVAAHDIGEYVRHYPHGKK